MKLSEIFRRQTATDEAFGRLESSLSEMLMVEMVPPLSPDEQAHAGAPAAADGEAEPAGGGEIVLDVEEEAPEAPRTTAHTQTRLAELAAFEGLQQAAYADLELVSGTLAKIKVAQHQTREFLNGIHAGIHRANELELSVARLTAENRVLFRQAEHVNRLRGQHEALVEAVKRRESKLVETAETLRAALAATKLDLVEARGTIGALEAERQDAANALAAATTQAERTARENEVLREKHINLVADLETASRKRTEAERRVDEYAAIHARDTADLAATRSKLAGVESERQRLQKQNDALQERLREVSETLAALESDMEEQAKRHDLGLQGLKNERDTLQARLEVSARAELEAAERVGALTDSLNDAVAERRIAEERLAAMLRERERDADRIAESAELQREVARLQALVGSLSAAARARNGSGGGQHEAPGAGEVDGNRP